MSKKIHNPKSHAPAVYIPCWLIQVSVHKLSYAAKILYGRLSQWASSSGIVFRSIPQLSEELGCSERSINSYLKELKDADLIGTYHPQAGGQNYYEFYDHPWMYAEINEHLVYKQDKFTPTQDPALPHAGSCVTPTQDPAFINKKEIKEIKCVGETATHSTVVPFKNTQERIEIDAKENEEFKELFKNKFSDRKINYEDLYKACKEHYNSKRKWITPALWKKWIETESIDNYPKSNNYVPALRIPTENDFRRHEEGKSGFDFVSEFIAYQLSLARPNQEYLQMHHAKGFKWVNKWVEAQGLAVHQK